MRYIFLYLLVISVVTVYLTLKDKKAAEIGKRRIPEATLLWIGFFGGALAELITMKLRRHKTQHLQFMLGLPVMILFHVVLLYHLFFIWNIPGISISG